MKNTAKILTALMLSIGFVFTATAQDQSKDQPKDQPKEKMAATKTADADSSKTTAGKKKIYGILVKRDGNNLLVRDRAKTEYKVSVTDATKIQERKSNPFRGARQYDNTSLVRGLWLEIEGRGGDSGEVVAERIKFTDAEFRDASSLEARVDPVEGRVSETETRVTQAEQNAQRLAGQIDELSAVANTAKGGAKAAQETADKAIAEVAAANERINTTNQRVAAVDERVTNVDQRLNAADDFEAKNTITINFKAASAVLNADAKAALDEIANQAKNEKAYVIQVAGFASADGDKDFNRRLSERRADAVIRYLIENHDIPQRRIITPFGYGELKPAADNATHDGRGQNRRVEVAILVSKGLSGSTGTEKSGTSSVHPQQ